MPHPLCADVAEAKVREMLRVMLGHNKNIALQTELLHDLGLTGDDANELLTNISLEFGTSFEGCKFATYFPNETNALFLHWWQRRT